MTTIEDFKTASFEQKCNLVMAATHFIASRKMDGNKIYLYHTGAFFIEVYYSIKYDRILAISPFNDLEGITPYAENVSLGNLEL